MLVRAWSRERQGASLAAQRSREPGSAAVAHRPGADAADPQEMGVLAASPGQARYRMELEMARADQLARFVTRRRAAVDPERPAAPEKARTVRRAG